MARRHRLRDGPGPSVESKEGVENKKGKEAFPLLATLNL